VLSFTLLSFKVKLDFISKLTSHFKVITQMWQTIFPEPLQATTSILFLFLFFSHLLVAKSLQGPFDRRGQLDYPLIIIIIIITIIIIAIWPKGWLASIFFSFGKNIKKLHELTFDFRITPSIFKCTLMTYQNIKMCQKDHFCRNIPMIQFFS
jgi:hypothetical protein